MKQEEWKSGDKFWLIKPSKNFPELYGKELTVGILWGRDKTYEVTPVEEFCTIPVKHITKINPKKVKPKTVKPEEVKFEILSISVITAFINGLIKGFLLIWLIKELF